MRHFTAGLVGLTLALTTVAGAMAQTPAPAAAAAAAKPSVESTTIGDLLANPATKAVLAKDMPGLLTYDGLDQIKGMTLRAVEPYSEGKVDDAMLTTVQKDFDALPAQ
jgi:hypothetical protein